MNISKLILSVNIAATLPIAVQTVAHASEIVDQNNSQSNQRSTRGSVVTNSNKISVAKKSFDISRPAKSRALEVDGVRLCAFVPNRPMPSSRQLQVPLRSEQPQ